MSVSISTTFASLPNDLFAYSYDGTKAVDMFWFVQRGELLPITNLNWYLACTSSKKPECFLIFMTAHQVPTFHGEHEECNKKKRHNEIVSFMQVTEKKTRQDLKLEMGTKTKFRCKN